jgi:tryptophan-rich sensory protein
VNDTALPLAYPWISSFVICAVAAALEGICAGTGVKQRFAELIFPTPSLPLWAWSLIGVAYYGIHVIVLHALLISTPFQPLTVTALVLVGVVLITNAAWNYLFFRRKDLRSSFYLSVPYALLAAALGVVLWATVRKAALSYIIYLVYLPYGTWWGYAVWRLNEKNHTDA